MEKTYAVQHYDPMADFWKKGIDFLFKQTPAIVLCLCACFVLWNEMNRRDNDNKAEMARLNETWSTALNISREDWRMCEEKRHALEIEVEKLKIRFEKHFKK